MEHTRLLGRMARIARLTVLEGVRTRFVPLVAVLVVVAVVLALFAGSLAITESAATRSLVLASFLRMGCVFLLALAVVTAMAREFDDKAAELFLSLPMPRHAYFLARLAGFGLLALCTALMAMMPVGLAASWPAALAWALSLACELLLVAAASLTLAVTFPQPAVALVCLAGFYLLARVMPSLQLMAHGVFHSADTWTNHATRWLLDSLALLLPDFDAFTRSDWLIQGQAWSHLPAIGGETFFYFLLLTAAGLVDLQRKNL